MGRLEMKIREKIYESINEMDARELSILYGQIKSMQMIKRHRLAKKKKTLPIEKIHEMTSSSESSWSDTVVQDREDRL
jgi:hypothetical protein